MSAGASSRSKNFESRQESVSSNTCLCKYRAQSRALDPAVIGYSHRRPRPILILTQESNVVTSSYDLEPEALQSLYDILEGNVNRELGSHTATPVSAMKTSSAEDASSRTSGPKVST